MLIKTEQLLTFGLHLSAPDRIFDRKTELFQYTAYNNEIQSNQMKAESKVWTRLWSFVLNWFMFGLDGMN